MDHDVFLDDMDNNIMLDETEEADVDVDEADVDETEEADVDALDLSCVERGDFMTKRGFPKQQVVLALLTALLRKIDLNECYFWLFELVDSGYDVFGFLWHVYFEFFYVVQEDTQLEDYIGRKQLEENPYAVIRNLFRFKAVAQPFLWRQMTYYMETHEEVYLEYEMLRLHLYAQKKKTSWLRLYNEKCHTLLLHLYSEDLVHLCYELKYLFNKGVDEEVMQTIFEYFKYNPKMHSLVTARTSQLNLFNQVIMYLVRLLWPQMQANNSTIFTPISQANNNNNIQGGDALKVMFINVPPLLSTSYSYTLPPLIKAFELYEENEESVATTTATATAAGSTWRQWFETVFHNDVNDCFEDDSFKLRF
jgi:hypothetical protein